MVRDAEQLHDPFAEHAGDELAIARFHEYADLFVIPTSARKSSQIDLIAAQGLA